MPVPMMILIGARGGAQAVLLCWLNSMEYQVLERHP